MKLSVVTLLLFHISTGSAQSDGAFLIYNAHKNQCLQDSLQELTLCNPQNPKQQFRWTSENRIFNVAQKKCLGTGVKSEGNKLQWFICDSSSDFQKWECHNNTLFGLKNEFLYLSLQGDTSVLTLSTDPGDKGKWTVHGTTDSVCSLPYEELYTLKGNAFGRPCHFPFHFNNKWYINCTTEGRSSKQPWCAVESQYDPNQLWGYCPTQEVGDGFWRKNPLTNVYYQLNEGSALSWYQARKSCQQQAGDLLSITEPHEQTFISGLTRSTGPVLWIGLNSLDDSSGWHWVNGQPLRYLQWLSGQPSSLPGHSCGVLSQHHISEWSTALCSETHGYICQRGVSTPTVPPAVHTGSCTTPWIPYLGHCYHLFRTKKTWLEAKDTCRREGGDLLSVLSVEEQSFVISQLGYLKTDEVWIGLNDLKTAMLFDWSDHSSVPFVLWDVNEPSHDATLKEDCVSMRGEEGKWADQNCQNKYGHICKKKTHLRPSTNDTVVTSPGCKPGWTKFGSYCYLAGTEAKTFKEAKKMCEERGSYLADITRRVENAFLVSLIGTRPEKHFWIGLSNQKNGQIFKWTNTEKVPFTNFNAGMPGGKQGCVAMTTGVLAGLWDVLSCTNSEKYICKQRADGVTTTLPPPVTSFPRCSEGWSIINKREMCFKYFNPEYKSQKTWFEALDFCQEVGGDLLGIEGSSITDHFKFSVVVAWVGLSDQDPSDGYTRSNGSPGWTNGERNNSNNKAKCEVLQHHWLEDDGKLSDSLQCEDRLPWICEIQKGVKPKEVAITSKTYNITDDGWVIFKDNQYYFNTLDFLPMKEAQSFCKHRHGDLVVINDVEEKLFLWYQMKEKKMDFYIGMNIDLDKSISWMDGSPVVFEAWAKKQPALLNSEEHCVKMTWIQGLWESVNCGDYYRFVCKRSGSVEVNSTAAPTEPPKGGCAPDWVKFQEKCYKIGLDLKTWTKARSYCRGLGGDLASITSIHQQAFLTLMMKDDTPDLWIGFNNLAGRRYRWTDGSPVLYTGWAKRVRIMDTACVAMGSVQNPELGTWVKKECKSTSAYICSRALDPLITPSSTELPKTFIKLGNSLYLLVQTNLTWKAAKQNCEAEGAKLASIRDLLTQSYIELQAHKLGQPLWVGLNSQETGGFFQWIDTWQLNMERWGPNEPKSYQPCVYVDVDGKWKTAQCNQTYYSICKKSKDIPPAPPTQYPGVCPEQTDQVPKMIWLPFRGNCYSFAFGLESWYTASQICMSRGAQIVSIVDTMEAKFLQNYIQIFGNDFSLFWIGLFKKKQGDWLWLDDSVVDVLNWDEAAESKEEDDELLYSYEGPDPSFCGVISVSTTLWEKRLCRYNHFPFICKATKVIIPTTEPTPTGADKTHRWFSGVSLLVVIALLCVVTGLIYSWYKNSKKHLPTSENPMQVTTTALPDDKDTKVLVNQIEINEEAPDL
ncbi:macrophage mannose receptor 1-like isoform X2 [Hoplias malabaricus]|uniref:macrophage mannose receptor 1-like isoform X2 n=1 Tax=Hoplias malabaricus TaxID=27720 RepID=UPI0034635D74